MGHIQYYLQYKDQPVIYRAGANPGNTRNKYYAYNQQKSKNDKEFTIYFLLTYCNTLCN